MGVGKKPNEDVGSATVWPQPERMGSSRPWRTPRSCPPWGEHFALSGQHCVLLTSLLFPRAFPGWEWHLDEMAAGGQRQFSGEEGSCELWAVNSQSSCQWVCQPGKAGQSRAPTALLYMGFHIRRPGFESQLHYLTAWGLILGKFPKFPKPHFSHLYNGNNNLLLFSARSAASDSLQPHGLQRTRLPCASLSPRCCPNSCSSNRWCCPIISSSVTHFSSCPQSFPAWGSFPMSWFFVLGWPKCWSFSFSISPSNEYSGLILSVNPLLPMRLPFSRQQVLSWLKIYSFKLFPLCHFLFYVTMLYSLFLS